MAVYPIIFAFIFILSWSFNFPKWVKKSSSGELSSILSTIQGPADYYQKTGNTLEVNLYENRLEQKSTLTLTFYGITENFEKQPWIEFNNTNIKVQYIAFRKNQPDIQSKHLLFSKDVNVQFIPKTSLRIIAEGDQIFVYFSEVSKNQNNDQQVSNLAIKNYNSSHVEEDERIKSEIIILENNTTNQEANNSVKQKIKTSLYSNEFEQILFFYFLASLLVSIFYAIIKLKQFQGVLSSSMDLFLMLSEAIFWLEYLPTIAINQRQNLLIILVIGLVVMCKAYLIGAYYIRVFILYSKSGQLVKIILTIITFACVFTVSYAINLFLAILLLIHDTVETISKSKVTSSSRYLFHLQTTLSLSFILSQLSIFETPKDWPFDYTTSLWMCISIWVYLTTINEMSYRKNSRHIIRKENKKNIQKNAKISKIVEINEEQQDTYWFKNKEVLDESNCS